jgi:hypothetical protein
MVVGCWQVLVDVKRLSWGCFWQALCMDVGAGLPVTIVKCTSPAPQKMEFLCLLSLPFCPLPQACVDLPAMDCEPAALADCYKGAATCADYFWTLSFDRWAVLGGAGGGAGGWPSSALLTFAAVTACFLPNGSWPCMLGAPTHS